MDETMYANDTAAPGADFRLKDQGQLFQVEDRREFRERFDQVPFGLKHRLTPDHPLFRMDRIRELATFLQKEGTHVHCDVGDVRTGQRWNEAAPPKWSFEETLERIDQADAWIFLRQIEKDPEYGELLDQFMLEVSEFSGRDIKKEQQFSEAILFITSPRRITSYHIDRECNFLLQVSGDKDIHVFDRNDRDVLPEQEIERFWSVDNNAATYREQYENRATVYRLQPGNGVHIPVNCPHWLQNGASPSISLSVNYQFKDKFRKHLYQSNYYLRRMGIRPTPPGQSPARDMAKKVAMGSLQTVRRVFTGPPPPAL